MEESSMKHNMSAPQEEGSKPGGDELKKLRKREQRVLERLQEARKAQTKALERFQRAEARLQKRSDRLQRIHGRLTLLRQQLSGQETPQSNEVQPPPSAQPVSDQESVTTGIAPDVTSETEAPGAEEPSPSAENPVPNEDTAQPEPVSERRAAVEATEENVRLA